ncbi:MAG: metal ABC transporter substrate-binding protein [Actinomycetota bacterium]
MRGFGRFTRHVLLVGLGAVTITSTACGGGGAGASDSLVVVSSVAPLVDMIERVAGSRAEVRGLVPPGENGHTYVPRPSDARTLSDASLFIDNGLSLNNVVRGSVSGNLPKGADIHFLSEGVPESELIGNPDGCHEGHCHGPVNAHLWPDPNYASIFVDEIVKALSAVDKDGADEYRRNGQALQAQMDRLDEAITEASATVPEASRKLVVYHNAWAYFARRYGFTMIGALQVLNFAEPSAREVRGMIDQIKAEGVPAFFGSEVFPSDVLGAVEEATGARYVPDLADDRLPGEPGAPGHSYVGMMATNAKLIVEALGGDTAALDAFLGSLQ